MHGCVHGRLLHFLATLSVRPSPVFPGRLHISSLSFPHLLGTGRARSLARVHVSSRAPTCCNRAPPLVWTMAALLRPARPKGPRPLPPCPRLHASRRRHGVCKLSILARHVSPQEAKPIPPTCSLPAGRDQAFILHVAPACCRCRCSFQPSRQRQHGARCICMYQHRSLLHFLRVMARKSVRPTEPPTAPPLLPPRRHRRASSLSRGARAAWAASTLLR
jgi:hypothetical protein